MADQETLEQRVETLEQTVAQLKRQQADRPVPESWIEKFSGSVSDDEAFVQAMEYGRAIRQADRPPDEPDET